MIIVAMEKEKKMNELCFNIAKIYPNKYKEINKFQELLEKNFKHDLVDVIWNQIESKYEVVIRLGRIETSESIFPDTTQYKQKLFVKEIIYCKDCKYWRHDHQLFFDQYYCGLTEKQCEEDHFCSWAERKKDETN